MIGLEDLIVGTLLMMSLLYFEEVEKEFEDLFMDINAPNEIMIDYEAQEDVGVGEFSSFVYGYSMTVELPDKPRISSRSKKRKVSPSITDYKYRLSASP